MAGDTTISADFATNAVTLIAALITWLRVEAANKRIERAADAAREHAAIVTALRSEILALSNVAVSLRSELVTARALLDAHARIEKALKGNDAAQCAG